MPDIINLVAALFPSTWMTLGFRLVSIKNLGLDLMWPTLLVLAGMALLAIFFALSFKKESVIRVDDSLSINGGYSYPRKVNRLRALRQQIGARHLSCCYLF